MNKKSLMIYFPEWKLAPKGGPAGYLYNLKTCLDKKFPELPFEIDFYNKISEAIEDNAKLRSFVPDRIKDIRRALKYSGYLKRRRPVDEELLKYDIIHFHSTEDMYLNRDMLQAYSGKVILTSHRPCVPYQETVARINPFDYKLFKRSIDKLVEMDVYAFERADYIIFPCEEAEEPYYNTWPEYSSIRKSDKYRYMPTGINGCHAKVSRSEYREKYNIPEDAFVVAYVGRHNEIKGYADLKKIGEKFLQDDNTYFLIGGKEEPLEGLDNNRWIEVGWTDDPYSLIAAADVFILPNRETYFDLVLLEVLSLGVPVALTWTGGNKYFDKYHKDGLKYFSTIDEGIAALEKFKNMPSVDRKRAGDELAELWTEDFTVEKFVRRYIDIITEIAYDGEKL